MLCDVLRIAEAQNWSGYNDPETPGTVPIKWTKASALLLLIFIIWSPVVCAQLVNGADNLAMGAELVNPGSRAESDSSDVSPVPPQSAPGLEVPHAFWDRTNTFLFTGVATFRALDYASTRNMMARGREEILLPDDVVKSSAGFPALEVAATGASIGLSYGMHRLGHHKIERWVSIVHISVTGFGAVRNYCLESKHPAP